MTNAQRRARRPATTGEEKLDGAVKATLAAGEEVAEQGDELTPDDEAALDGEKAPPARAKAPAEAEDDGETPEGAEGPEEPADPSTRAEALLTQSFTTIQPDGEFPEWATIPEGLKLPKGKLIYVMRIPAEWTDKPGEGERQCIMWNLNVPDEDMALKRARGDDTRANRELAMAMIRAVDGHVADWTLGKRGPGDVRKWFNDIGPRGRLLVQTIYLRTHTVDAEMRLRFFADCFAFTTSG